MDKKKIFFCVFILFFVGFITIFLLLVKRYDHPVRAIRNSDFKIKITNEYKINKIIGEEDKLNKPYGLAWVDNYLIVSDSGKNRILFLNENGDIIKEIGNTGNGPVEFLKPMGIAVDNQKRIYIVDADNQRLQIIDIEGRFLEEIKLHDYIKKQANTYLTDVAVDNTGSIYVSVYTNQMKYAKIFYISSDRKIKWLDDRLEGIVTGKNGRVFFVSQMEFYKKDGINVAGSGVNFLLEIDEGKTIAKYEIPYKFFATGICIQNDFLYLVSGGHISIDKFDFNGNYLGSIFNGDFNEHKGMSFITMDKNNNLYVSDIEKNVIYKLERNN